MKHPLALVVGAILVASYVSAHAAQDYDRSLNGLPGTGWGAGTPPTQSPPPPSTPNLLVIMLDDVGIGDLGVYGSTTIQTPELDELASEGLRLTSFDTSGALCSPTRSSYLTGRYPIDIGFYNAVFFGSQRGLAAAYTTLPEILRDAGYSTGHAGKWHLGYDSGTATDEFLPPAAGFDWSARLVIPQQPNHYDPTFVLDEQQSVQTVGHETTIITDYAVSFLDDQVDDPRPFFLSVCYYAPHLPAQAPQSYLDLYPDTSIVSVYGAMLTQVDAEIGRLLEHLERLGHDQDTLVVVFSDNGGADAAGLHPQGNGGLAGYKRDVLEGGLRTPFIARYPGTIPAGAVNDSLMVSLDLLPTVLPLLGVANPLADLPGRDMSAALLNPAPVARPDRLFWSSRASLWSFPSAGETADTFAVRQDQASFGDGDWKLVYLPAEATGPQVALYDLDTDPGETTDRSAEFPGLVTQLWDAYWVHHAAVTEIDWTGIMTGLATPITGGFDFVNGAVTLPPQAPFDSHDGDFSVRLRATPTGLLATAGGQVLATKPGSWELWVDANGTVTVDFTLADGSTASLSSTTLLTEGATTAVGFKLTAWPLSPLDAALLVDGVVETTSTLPGPLAPNRNPIVLGNDALNARPFVGQVFETHFHTSALATAQFVEQVPAMP